MPAVPILPVDETFRVPVPARRTKSMRRKTIVFTRYTSGCIYRPAQEVEMKIPPRMTPSGLLIIPKLKLTLS
jgi:hypothetical protein